MQSVTRQPNSLSSTMEIPVLSVTWMHTVTCSSNHTVHLVTCNRYYHQPQQKPVHLHLNPVPPKHTHTHNTRTFTYLTTSPSIHTYLYPLPPHHTHTHTHTHTQMQAHAHANIHIQFKLVYMKICACACTYTYTHTQACTHKPIVTYLILSPFTHTYIQHYLNMCTCARAHTHTITRTHTRKCADMRMQTYKFKPVHNESIHTHTCTCNPIVTYLIPSPFTHSYI